MHDALVRILYVGGDSAEYRFIGELLDSVKHTQYQLSWCYRPDDALGEILSDEHDAILLDFHDQADMASSLLAEARMGDCQQPIIAITSLADSELGLEATRNGAMDFLAREEINAGLLERCIHYAVERQEVDRKLAQLNHYDPLTGIPNRVLFHQTLEQAITRAKVQQATLALLLINLDGFKKINESFGHDAGDNLVANIAERLSRCVRKSDSVARIGGDEFTIILDDCNSTDDVALVVKKVIDILAAPFTVESNPLIISCSVGVSFYPDSGESVDALLRHANMAMLEAKSQRGSNYRFYNENTNTETIHRINLETDLRRALRRNEFEMYYQPRVKLETGDIAGMEGLIRWRHPTRGLVSPAEFIPVAEETGLIMPLGYWIIQQVCEDMKEFDKYGQDLDVAINLSFRQLQDSMFVDTATRIIEQSGVDATRLEFELTETAIMSSYQQTYEGMMALSKLGICFSLDDFGTGFSSFAHIQRLPISALKVDRSFIRSVVKNDDDAIIVKAMINLAHSLRLRVIAEGVETLDQVQFLWQHNCDQVQGFYFSPAVACKDFTLMIQQRATVAV